MERCPACRARLAGQPLCRRCGSDLTLALAAERQARQWTRRALQQCAEGDFDQADAALERARVLHNNPLAARLRLFLTAQRRAAEMASAPPEPLVLSTAAVTAEQHESRPPTPMAETGRRLLRALTGAAAPLARTAPEPPEGLVVELADACAEYRSGALSRPAGSPAGTTGRAGPERSGDEATPPIETLKTVRQSLREAAIDVHRSLGPGLPASVYESCLVQACDHLGIACRRQVPLAVRFRDGVVDSGYRADLLLENALVVMIEGADNRGSERHRLTLNYLCMAGWVEGVMIDFNAAPY